MKDHTISEDESHRFVDGELSTKQAEQFSAIAARDPDLALQIEQYRRINKSLHLGFDNILDEAIPQPLLQATVYSSNWNLYAIAATLVIGVLVGYFTRALQPVDIQQPLTQVALSSHAVFIREARHAVEVGADEVDHLNAWLSKRLQSSVIAPDLTEYGLGLIGGRLLADAGKPAAQFMYENRSGGRFTLYIRNDGHMNNQDSSLHYKPQQEFGVTYWYQGELSYALTGVDNSEYLLELARRMQLNNSLKISL